MAMLWPLLLTALLQAPEVEAATLDGETVAGELAALNEQAAVLRVGDATREIPLPRLLSLQFSSTGATTSLRGHSEITRLDGARLLSHDPVATTAELQFTSPALGRIKFPLETIAHIRFQTSDASLDDDWREMCQRELRNDLLVIRKEREGVPFLDFVDGVVGEFDEKQLKLLLDGATHELQRERVFGVIYYRRNADTPASDAFRMKLTTGESTPFASIGSQDAGFRVTLPQGTEVTISAEHLAELDFSQGKVLYLSDMEPRDVKYTPFFDITWEYRRDTNLDGGPLRLGGKAYRRGLCLHSRTQLLYRIGGEYRRLQAVMGIDQNVTPLGDVHVVIQGDGQNLLETDVRGDDDPRPIDLDVSGVRELQILVDFGEGLDIADHLSLADVRVIK